MRNIAVIFAAFLITRMILIYQGISLGVVGPFRPYDIEREMERYGRIGTIFHGWDSEWYLEIAESGYGNVQMDAEGNKSDLVFFPVYPVIIRIVSYLTGNTVISALLISNIFYFLSGVMLYKLIEVKFIQEKDKTAALAAALLLFTFPMSHIFSGIQSESVFLFLLLLSFYFLEKGNIFYAALSGFLLSLTKHVGFLIFVPILYFSFRKYWHAGLFKKLKVFLYTLLPFMGLAVYAYYMYLVTGDFYAIVNLERGWNKFIDFNILKPFILLANNSEYEFLTIFNFSFAMWLIILALLGAVKLGGQYLLMTLAYFFVYMTTTRLDWHTFSLPRYFSVLFPIYFYVAYKIRTVKVFTYGTIVVFFILQLVIYNFWVLGVPIPM